MADIIWRMKGSWLKNCSCAFGCPCDFNALPTNTVCEGMVGMKIDEGHFDSVSLSGLSWASVYKWPGPLYKGGGTLQPIIDEKADDKQREALLTILSGQKQVEGTFFHIVSTIVAKLLEPQFLPITFDFDLEKRKANVKVDGIFETVTEPIKNPVTGLDHRVRVNMPQGFEHDTAEIGCAVINKGIGEVQFDWPNSHSTLTHVEHTSNGVVHG